MFTTTTTAIRQDMSEALAIVKKLAPLYTAVQKSLLSRHLGETNLDEEFAAADKEIGQALSILQRAQKRGTVNVTNPASE
jgi:hypothetical protein